MSFLLQVQVEGHFIVGCQSRHNTNLRGNLSLETIYSPIISLHSEISVIKLTQATTAIGLTVIERCCFAA